MLANVSSHIYHTLIEMQVFFIMQVIKQTKGKSLIEHKTNMLLRLNHFGRGKVYHL